MARNTRDVVLLCNNLLYWYFLGNAKNQEQGYGELEFFLDSLDDEIPTDDDDSKDGKTEKDPKGLSKKELDLIKKFKV